MVLNFYTLDSYFSESKVSDFYEVMTKLLNLKYYVTNSALIKCIKFKSNLFDTEYKKKKNVLPSVNQMSYRPIFPLLDRFESNKH